MTLQHFLLKIIRISLEFLIKNEDFLRIYVNSNVLSRKKISFLRILFKINILFCKNQIFH